MIAGIDEAGRGAWVGNVVAAAVILPADYDLPLLSDSKKLSPKQRENLFSAIYEQAIAIGIGQMSAQDIDNLNILQATMQAMRQAALNLEDKNANPVQVAEFLIDGNRVPENLPAPARAIIGGDAKIAAISAASIIAKVTRDRQMLELGERYPHYGFAAHKGYGTAAHQKAIAKFGILPEHRRSYKPIKALLQDELF